MKCHGLLLRAPPRQATPGELLVGIAADTRNFAPEPTRRLKRMALAFRIKLDFRSLQSMKRSFVNVDFERVTAASNLVPALGYMGAARERPQRTKLRRRNRNLFFRAAPALSAFDREEIPCALVAQSDFQFLAGHREIALDDAHGTVMLPVFGQPLEQKLALDFLMLRHD